jgi:hypothetical protein
MIRPSPVEYWHPPCQCPGPGPGSGPAPPGAPNLLPGADGLRALLYAFFLADFFGDDFFTLFVDTFSSARSIAFSTNLSVRIFLTDFSRALFTALTSFLLILILGMVTPQIVFGGLGPQIRIAGTNTTSMAGSGSLLLFRALLFRGHIFMPPINLEILISNLGIIDWVVRFVPFKSYDSAAIYCYPLWPGGDT